MPLRKQVVPDADQREDVAFIAMYDPEIQISEKHDAALRQNTGATKCTSCARKLHVLHPRDGVRIRVSSRDYARADYAGRFRCPNCGKDQGGLPKTGVRRGGAKK